MPNNSTSFSIFLKDYFSKPLVKIGNTANKATGKIDRDLDDVGTHAKKAGNKIGGMANPMQKIMGLAAGLGLAFGFSSLISSAVRMSIEFEKTNIAMGVMLGSTEKATEMVMGLEKFALATPFTPQQLNKSAQMMLGFGQAAKDIIPNVKMLGDIAQGDQQRMESLTLAFSQAMATGKLMGQDLLQMINAGFNPLKVIAEKTGTSIGFLKEQMSKGAITSDVLKAAFVSATSEGGLYHGMMGKIAQTYGGKLSTAQGNFNKLLQLLGDKITAKLLPALDWFNSSWENMIPWIDKIGNGLTWITNNMDLLGVVIGIMAAAKIGALIMSLSTLSIVTKIAAAGQWLLNVALTANPIGLVIAAIAALVGGLWLAWNRSEKFRGVLLGIWEVLKPIGTLIWKWMILPLKVLTFMLKNIWNVVKEPLGKVYNFFADKLGGIFTWIGEKIEKFIGWLKNIPGVAGILDKFKTGFDKGADKPGKTPAESGADSVADDGSGAAANGLLSSLNFGAGGKKGKNTGIGLSGVKGDGKVSKNITVNIEKLVETLSLTSETVTEGVTNIREMVAEALTDAVRDVELSY